MYADINLAIKKDSHVLKQEQLKRIKLISFSILFLVAFSSILIFLVNLRFSTNSIKKDQDKAIAQITDNNQTAARIFLINSRLADVDFVLKNRKTFSQTMDQVISLNPGSIEVKELTISDGKADITLVATSLSDLNDSLNAILESYPKKEISNISMKSLQADTSGFTVKLELKFI